MAAAGAITAESSEIDGGIGLPAALVGSDPLGGDWYASEWFGNFALDSANKEPWVFSRDFGWVYISPTGTPAGAWLYSSSQGNWMWGGSGLDRFFYNANAGQWMWVLSNPNPNANGAWLYYESDKQWQFLNP